jgi:AmmeMemoRadiSam system protein B
MATRRAYRAGSFYPSDARSCRQQIEECLGDYQPPAEPGRIVSGIVPHAGWIFSGPTAAKVFKSAKEKAAPETFLIFGAVHVWGVGKASMSTQGAWETPCGTIAIDEELANVIQHAIADNVTVNAAAHDREHSIEVQIPFIQYLFPEAKILPIMVTPGSWAADLGQKIGKLLAEQEKKVFVLGSTDLTHYGPSFGFTPYGVGTKALTPMKDNDRRIIDLAIAMKAEEVVNEAEEHRNACGAGAIAATVAAAKELGAQRGYLLEYTTSQDVMPERQATDFVGYAGIIF